jgi:hypothetical protein
VKHADSTATVDAELRVANQYFGPAEKLDAAINACGHGSGSGQLGLDIIGIAVLRIVQRAVGPMARTIGLQPPDDGQAA